MSRARSSLTYPTPCTRPSGCPYLRGWEDDTQRPSSAENYLWGCLIRKHSPGPVELVQVAKVLKLGELSGRKERAERARRVLRNRLERADRDERRDIRRGEVRARRRRVQARGDRRAVDCGPDIRLCIGRAGVGAHTVIERVISLREHEQRERR